MTYPRVLVADDHQGILNAVSRLLCVSFDVVAVVKDGQQAIEAAAKLHPDVIVLDISMPIVNGIEAASILNDLGFSGKIIFLSSYEDGDMRAAALSVGARGYVIKTRLATDLIPTILGALDHPC